MQTLHLKCPDREPFAKCLAWAKRVQRSRPTERRLSDRSIYGDDWPVPQGDPDGPGGEWDDKLFYWAVGRVNSNRAAGHNRIQVELYKHSSWARGVLRKQLKQVWETGVFPEHLITGVATAIFKSGDQE